MMKPGWFEIVSTVAPSLLASHRRSFAFRVVAVGAAVALGFAVGKGATDASGGESGESDASGALTDAAGGIDDVPDDVPEDVTAGSTGVHASATTARSATRTNDAAAMRMPHRR